MRQILQAVLCTKTEIHTTSLEKYLEYLYHTISETVSIQLSDVVETISRLLQVVQVGTADKTLYIQSFS